MPSSLPTNESISRTLIPPTPESDFGNSPQSPPSQFGSSVNHVDETKPATPQKRKAGRKPLYKTAQERRDRNRRAQLAFRARRSDYLAKLEDTCRSYELVVAELQESNRVAHDTLARERVKVKFLERMLQNSGSYSQLQRLPTGYPSVAAISLPSGEDLSASAGQQGVSGPPFPQDPSLVSLEQQMSTTSMAQSAMTNFLYSENYLGMLPTLS